MGKYLTMGITFLLILVFAIPLLVNHTGNTMTAERVVGALESATLGAMRNDPQNYAVDMEDTIANVTMNILKAQENNKRNLEVSYVFFDRDGAVTTATDEATGVQYRVRLLDNKGAIQSETVKKLILKEG